MSSEELSQLWESKKILPQKYVYEKLTKCPNFTYLLEKYFTDFWEGDRKGGINAPIPSTTHGGTLAKLTFVPPHFQTAAPSMVAAILTFLEATSRSKLPYRGIVQTNSLYHVTLLVRDVQATDCRFTVDDLSRTWTSNDAT